MTYHQDPSHQLHPEAPLSQVHILDTQVWDLDHQANLLDFHLEGHLDLMEDPQLGIPLALN